MTFSAHRFALVLFAAVLAVWAIVMVVLVRGAALPPVASGTLLAVFEPGISEMEAVKIIAAAKANVVKQSGFNFAWLVQSDEPGLAGRLQANGALGAYRELPINIALMGCVAIVDKRATAFIN